MPGPRVTALVTAGPGLAATLRSLEDQALPGLAAVACGPMADAKEAASLAALAAPATEHPLTGRTAGGLPYSVLADAGYAEAFAEAAGFSDAVLFLAAGDVVRPGAVTALAAACLAEPAVGAAWCDHTLAGVRVYQEPFDRPRLLDGLLEPPPAWAASVPAVARAGGPAGGLFDLLARLTEAVVVTHLPALFLDLAPREPVTASERAAAVRRALSRCRA